VAFTSEATNLVSGGNELGPFSDVYLASVPLGGGAAPPVVTRISGNAAGQEANGASSQPSISGTGRWVAFVSEATNLGDGLIDNNGVKDVFVRDLLKPEAQVVKRVSVAAGNRVADGESIAPSIASNDDASLIDPIVAFTSLASNLVYLGNNPPPDLPPAAQPVEDAIREVQELDKNGKSDVYLRNLRDSVTTLVSVTVSGSGAAPDASWQPAISADGNVVAFVSQAKSADLLLDTQPPSTFENPDADVFVRDLAGQYTTQVSVDSSGVQHPGESVEPALTSDGAFVAFKSKASLETAVPAGIRQIYLRDRFVCLGGRRETGPVSGPVHDAEAGPAGQTIHDTNCDHVVQNNL
jgi:Tol biopolymer transport system component